VDRGRALGFSDPLFSPYFETTSVAAEDALKLHVLVDQSILEVFVNDGLDVCTSVFYMQHGSPTEISWRVEEGTVDATDLRVYTLKSIWK
jgi:sucrose-6-phosphate hydrolase SacC (GH32 family)